MNPCLKTPAHVSILTGPINSSHLTRLQHEKSRGDPCRKGGNYTRYRSINNPMHDAGGWRRKLDNAETFRSDHKGSSISNRRGDANRTLTTSYIRAQLSPTSHISYQTLITRYRTNFELRETVFLKYHTAPKRIINTSFHIDAIFPVLRTMRL